MEHNDRETFGEGNPDEATGDTNEPDKLQLHWHRCKKEDGVRPIGPGRGILSAPVAYSLLGLSILVSIVALGTTVILVQHKFSEVKISNAGYLVEISKWKSNVTGDFVKIHRSIGEMQAVVSRLRKDLSLGQPFDQWRRFNQTLYFFSSTEQTWDEAQNLCTVMNATLVVINSDGEQEYIRRYRNCDYWIGLHCTTEGTWRWVDGSDYTVNVKFWAIDQHNGTAGDCAVVSDGGLWQYRPCSSEHFPICEQPAP